nr:protein atonal homolog 1-like [Penaeus vannamei]
MCSKIIGFTSTLLTAVTPFPQRKWHWQNGTNILLLPGKSAYKHVPHREKPPHLVARRNARERRRVQSVNVAFARLRRVVPGTSGRSKRVSKVKILQGAIDYIYHLQDLLEEDSVPFSNNNCSSLHHESDFGVRSACSLRHSDNGAGVDGAGEGDGGREGEGPAGGPQDDSPQRPVLQESQSQDSISSFLSYGSDGAEGSGWSDAEVRFIILSSGRNK